MQMEISVLHSLRASDLHSSMSENEEMYMLVQHR